MNDSKTAPASIEVMARGFSSRIPHALDIGMVFEDASPDGKTRMRLPPQPQLSGDPGGKFFFNGVLFSLADSACGLAVLRSLGQFVPIATLDMRIDHFAPASMDADLIAVADCYRMTQSIAFVRCELLCGPQAKLAANVVATFMLSSSSKPPPALANLSAGQAS